MNNTVNTDGTEYIVNIDVEIKYIELKKIFKLKTIEYLKLNNYKFENNLHKFTLQSLHEKKYDIFEDILLNGSYDNDYCSIITEKIQNNKNKNENVIVFKYDILNLMAKNGYYDKKYYINIIESDKKKLDFNMNNGCSWLYNSILLYSHKYSENTIVEIIKNCDLICINTNKIKINKFIKKIFDLGYDNLLHCLLEKNIFDKNNLITTLDCKNVIFNKFIKSSELLYEFIIKNSQNKITVNHINYMFYLSVLKKLINSNNVMDKEELMQDYKNILCSNYIYNYMINIFGSIAASYYINNNTMLAKEILQNIDINKSISHFVGFETDVVEYNIIKLYSNVSNGLYSDDYIPLIKNIILIKHNIEVKYKDTDDFISKIKPIIPELLKIIQLKNLNFLETLFDKAVIDCNQELCMLLLKKNINYFCNFFTTNNSNDSNCIEMHNSIPNNKQIILNLLSNNLDDIILYMIEISAITLFKQRTYNSDGKFDSSTLSNTFLELLFLNNKIKLIKKIIDNQKNNNNYLKNNIMGNILFLSLYYNIEELTYFIFENYLQFVNYSIFMLLFKNNLYKTNNYEINSKSNINNNSYNNISGIELLFKTNSEWLIDKWIDQYITMLPHYLIDFDKNSLITMMIKNNKINKLEQIINLIGKNIFKHIPMFNRIYHIFTLSNGLELYWSCKKNLYTIASFFVSNKLGNIDYKDDDGNTCLILACENKMENVARELIIYSNLSLIIHKNNLGFQAIDYIKKNNLTNILELINKKILSPSSITLTISSPSNQSINSNLFTTNPFENPNLKQKELFFLTDWVLKNKK